MTEYAPAAIKALFDQVKSVIPQALMGGIVGDSAHTYGYHRGRNYVSSSDYSVQYSEDKKGDGEAACALDISWSGGSWQKTCSQRLMNAKNDARMNACREFYGSTNGTSVCGYDYKGNYNVTSDDSHLWHIHLSILRQYCNDKAAMLKIADVITASGSAPPPDSGGGGGGATLRRPWPSYMPTDEYFGLITGPNESHGGYYSNEKPDIKAIQQRFIKLGYVPGVTDPNSSWADGVYEQPTKDACTKWQKAKYASTTSRYGEVWNDDWKHLFTY
jgi:hypothetical protein